MNRVPVVICTAALMLAGCSDGEDEQARTVPQPSSPAATSPVATDQPSEVETTEEQTASADLNSMVLTLDDMPSGWTTAPELVEDEDDASTGTSFCGVEDADLDVDDKAGESVDAGFKESDFGPFVLSSVGQVQDPEDASAAMDAMLDAASQCTEWTETDDEGVETTYEISPLSFDNVGDDTIAFRISADTDGLPLTIDMVMWQRGPLLSVVALFGIGGTDAELLMDLVETVANRM